MMKLGYKHIQTDINTHKKRKTVESNQEKRYSDKGMR